MNITTFLLALTVLSGVPVNSELDRAAAALAAERPGWWVAGGRLLADRPA